MTLQWLSMNRRQRDGWTSVSHDRRTHDADGRIADRAGEMANVDECCLDGAFSHWRTVFVVALTRAMIRAHSYVMQHLRERRDNLLTGSHATRLTQ